MSDEIQGMPMGTFTIKRVPNPNRAIFYCNNVLVSGNQWDFQLYFSLIHEIAPGQIAASEEALVILTPEHALALSKALQKTIDAFIEKQGKIREVKLPEPEPPAQPTSKG